MAQSQISNQLEAEEINQFCRKILKQKDPNRNTEWMNNNKKKKKKKNYKNTVKAQRQIHI